MAYGGLSRGPILYGLEGKSTINKKLLMKRMLVSDMKSTACTGPYHSEELRKSR